MSKISRENTDIILAPVITERSTEGLKFKKYTFRVAKFANKIEIKAAVEGLFPGTKVEKVNTISMRGRHRRQGRTTGMTPSWKKAVVTLKSDSKTIEFFDGMA